MKRKKGLGCFGILLIVFIILCCALAILFLQKGELNVSALTEKTQKKA